ncbi:MAG: cysteine synthase A [Paludibacteraceae bacterium]|nr:cysteine synthase A [Paludibacteraceae bacterium]
MGKIYQSLIELIGRTPLLELKNVEQSEQIEVSLVVKLESFNPGGSVKDRAAFSMIEMAEKKGVLTSGGVIIEPTSGNTGIGLAWIASIKGYRLILTMPETMSIERQKLLKHLGAELVLTPGEKGMQGAIDKAKELNEEIQGSVILQQFDNTANPLAHETTTAEEIWEDTEGKVDILVACVGTGGTLCGTAKCLKSYNPDIKIIAVEPENSPVLSGGKAGLHKIQGIGAGFVPSNYDATLVDEIVTVSDEESFSMARRVAKEEGLLVGISSGASLSAAIKVAKRTENKGKRLVVILPDTGERYLSLF